MTQDGTDNRNGQERDRHGIWEDGSGQEPATGGDNRSGLEPAAGGEDNAGQEPAAGGKDRLAHAFGMSGDDKPAAKRSMFHRMARLGRVGWFVLKNINPHTVDRAITYIRRHGYRALRGKLLYKFSRKEMVADMAILRTEISWHMAQDLHRLDKPLTGSFRFPIPGLRCMEFQTVTAGTIPGPVRLRILDLGGELLRECILPGTHILDGDFTTFPFEPIPDSSGHRFLFELAGMEKPHPSLFYHKDAALPDIALDMPGSVNCRVYADEWKGDEYDLWIGKNEPVGYELAAQKDDVYARMPKISLLVPMYNTPETFFRDMVESVLTQTYGNWELCLVDGGSTNEALLQQAEAYAGADPRILFTRLGRNLGIAGNTNAAADLATGDFIGLLDHDDTLAPFALHDMVEALNREPDAEFLYSDEDKMDEAGVKRFASHFKPDFAPDTLRSYNYICHFTLLAKPLFDRIGRFREGYDGSQDYDLFLRASEQAKRIVHVPKILYHWRESQQSTARDGGAKPYVIEASYRALQSHLGRIGMPGTVATGLMPAVFDVRPAIQGEPLVSILIPNKDHIDDLKVCLETLQRKTAWKNYEILVVENNSEEKQTFHYYDSLKGNPKIRVIKWPDGFNFAAINNFAVSHAKGEFILLLNNDTEIIEPEWLTRMLEHAQRKDVGAVGAMLYYPDDTIQHAGVIIGMNTLADHAFKNLERSSIGYFGRTHIVQNVSAVTAACMLMRKSVFEETGGLDEDFAVAFNDVDLCMKIRKKDYLIVWTPYARLYHHESKSRGLEDTPKKQKRFVREIELFYDHWGKPHQLHDPYYNPNLSLWGSGYDLSI